MAANDMMTIRIVFGIMIGVFSLIFFSLAAIFHKYTILHRCNAKVKGIVKRYSTVSVGDGLGLPKVWYTVNGREYKIVGPMYRGVKCVSETSPTVQNEIDFEVDEKGVIRVKRHKNSAARVSHNPIAILHPIGSEIDVFYYDRNPKIAYVQKDYGTGKASYFIFLILGMTFAIAEVIIQIIL